MPGLAPNPEWWEHEWTLGKLAIQLCRHYCVGKHRVTLFVSWRGLANVLMVHIGKGK